jgi:heme-binding protein
VKLLPGTLTAMLSAFALVQVVRFPLTNPPTQGDLAAPAPVKDAIGRACADCHSNRTRWPWYANVAPVSWLAYRDVAEGRKRLNFSQWDSYVADPGTAINKLRKIAESTTGSAMPPWYYRLIHRDARLTESERRLIREWAARESASLELSTSKAGDSP